MDLNVGPWVASPAAPILRKINDFEARDQLVSGDIPWLSREHARSKFQFAPVYGPGEFFFESGDINHTVFNKTSEPMVHVLFEVLPSDLSGPSLIPVKHH